MHFAAQNAPNSVWRPRFAQTRWELTRHPSWIKGSLVLSERNGKKVEGRERRGREGEGGGWERQGMGKRGGKEREARRKVRGGVHGSKIRP